jgi:hypothetical protein
VKTYLRFIVLFVVAAAILFVIYLVRQATEPQSALIARERNRVYVSRDNDRMKNDPAYAGYLVDQLAFLDHRLAVAYNEENHPDKAIAILRRLIDDEEAKEKGGLRRRSLSYTNEANYFETLQASFDLKHDEAEVIKALDRRIQLMAKARELGRTEKSEEGKFVGTQSE